MKRITRISAYTLTAAIMALSGCFSSNGGGRPSPDLNQAPEGLIGEIRKAYYDGKSDDLLTAGLGQSGLATNAAPGFGNAGNPSPRELRRLAIYTNYRALVPVAPGGGYGEFFGPAVATASAEGLIPGHEWLAFMESGDGGRVTVMVQVPDRFDPDQACMITAPSSGSRGIYGAIGTGGEWGLKRGCAVVYTDKGTGMGVHNLERNTVTAIDGTLVEADAAGEEASFQANLTARERAAFNDAWPNRVAFKHAHSQQNPEKDWGRHVLDTIQFGFYALNELYGEEDAQGRRLATIAPDNTLVIASGVSNGGGAAVRALEQDDEGLIDGLAVSEPNVNPALRDDFTLRQGDGPTITGHSRSLLDYQTALAVYQGCANAAPAVAGAPFNLVTEAREDIAANACARLAALDLIQGDTTAERAEAALATLRDTYGFQPEQNLVQPVTWWANASHAIAVTYANAYGRFSVADNLCGFSFAATDEDGDVMPLADTTERALFATGNGIPPTGGVSIVHHHTGQGVAKAIQAARSPVTNEPDYSLDAFLCLRQLVDNNGPDAEQAARVQEGLDEIRASGQLRGRPAIFVTPRGDQILPINHTSRPYYGLNQRVEGESSQLRYYEVLNAQHLDILNNLPALDALFIPLHYYYFQALDLMYDYLANGRELAPSQVVRTKPRGTQDGKVPPLSAENLPGISQTPDENDLILFEEQQVRIPD